MFILLKKNKNDIILSKCLVQKYNETKTNKEYIYRDTTHTVQGDQN